MQMPIHTQDWKHVTNGILRSLIGRKGWGCPSSLHTRTWRSKGPKKTLMDEKYMRGFLHGKLWIMFHGALEFASSPLPRGRSYAYSYTLCYFLHQMGIPFLAVWPLDDSHKYVVTTIWLVCEVALRYVGAKWLFCYSMATLICVHHQWRVSSYHHWLLLVANIGAKNDPC